MTARKPKRGGAAPADPAEGVPGFRFAGIHCGIKERDPDLALIASDLSASVAGVFTRSTVVGAPVEWCRARVVSGRGRGVVVNSGISNVAMGVRGRRDAEAMARHAARAVGCEADEIYVASTGVIGEPLPMAVLRRGIPEAASQLSGEGMLAAAEAIRTTDTFAKAAARRVRVGGRWVRVAGIAKGSGMIEPDMATMLSFMTSDAAVAPRALQGMLRRVADRSFNRVTIDGEGSTSDSVLVFANGLAGNAVIRGPASPGAAAFEGALLEVAEDLARMLARDGEGATKLVTVEVSGARSGAEAERAARRIANSLLVKTAIFGGDPNWGRILQTIGAGRVAIDLARSEVKLCGVSVFRKGASAGPAARRRAEVRLADDEITIAVDLARGRSRARIWTCDLSYDYVKINAEYTT
ncbi:MAG: bifunctional glutamate N-acetyltransferase/amino-acid acetyltransferase ArgJ [Deltaproteobacteria bacterium]|nr:bifunctional glutamate N-acetyltransferase/amino-acid acetyltransferase ArgJ [Deltaproteobacteria bacterium]